MIFNASSLFKGNILQPETIVLNVSGRVLMVNREMNGNASEQLVSATSFLINDIENTLWLKGLYIIRLSNMAGLAV